MTITAPPRSDQWNGDDFIKGPRTFTIAGIKAAKKAADITARYDIELVEGEGRVWRPPLTVLRLLLAAWETDNEADWIGRRVTLFRDPTVRVMGEVTGGIRVSHASHLPDNKPFKVKLQVSKGKREEFRLEPLPGESPTDRRIAELKAEWESADPDRRAEIKAEVDKLRGGQA